MNLRSRHNLRRLRRYDSRDVSATFDDVGVVVAHAEKEVAD